MLDEGIFKTWYASGKAWIMINGKPEIYYNIKYAESISGLEWIRKDTTCIYPEHTLEVSARPSVIKEDGIYKMWYCKRNIDGFRDSKNKGYRGGFAESKDGILWERKDYSFGLSPADVGWDSEAIAYPYVINHKGIKLMFFNGNGFGKTGFGYAIREY